MEDGNGCLIVLIGLAISIIIYLLLGNILSYLCGFPLWIAVIIAILILNS